MTSLEQQSLRDANATSRRRFLQQSLAAVAGTAVTRALAVPAKAAEPDALKVALIGCGDRGTGAAAQALSTAGPIKLWAMADLFADRLESSLSQLTSRQAAAYDRESHQGFSERVEVPPERRFVGFDAYKGAIQSGADLVILTTPPHFRPLHFAYAVEHGKHLFMEKPLAVDAPGIRQVLAVNEEAKKKNLKVGVGLMYRHNPRCLETIQRIQAGAIGEISLMRCYWNTGVIRDTPPRPADQTEMYYQLRNPYHFVWLNGDYLVDALSHFIDLSLWVKGAHPVSAQGQGGRQFYTPAQSGDGYDHHTVEYTFADGLKLFAQTRQMPGCWNSNNAHIHGSKGTADLGRGVILGAEPWRYKGEASNPYQTEWDVLVEVLRKDKPHNEVDYAAMTTMTAVMGRMASYTGQVLQWEDALKSNVRLAPGKYAMDALPPVVADSTGRYPVAMPGTPQPG